MSRTTDRFLSFFILLFFFPATALAAHSGTWQVRDARMGAPKHYFSEFCTPLGQGQILQVEIETPHRVDFNIHFHTATDTLFPVREAVEGTAVFEITAKAGGEYCLMFTNPERRPEEFFIKTRYRVR